MSDDATILVPADLSLAVLQGFKEQFEPAFHAAMAEAASAARQDQTDLQELVAMLKRAHAWISNDNVHMMGPSELRQHRKMLADLEELIWKHGGAV